MAISAVRRAVRAGFRLASSASAAALVLLTAASASAAPTAQCQLQQLAQLDLTVTDHRALLPTEINGHKVFMIVDTGAGTSMLFRDALARLGLHEQMVYGGFRMSGVGGETRAGMVLLGTFTLGQITTRNLRLLVAGEHRMDEPEIVGLLGQDFLSQWDVEIDLAHKAVRLLRPVGCHGDQLVYWGAAYSQANIQMEPSLFTHTAVRALLNGKAIDAYLDTGAPVSVVTLGAAAQAGVTPNSPKVERTGSTGGLGAFVSPVWTATFDSFTVGDETIRNAKIKMSDMFSHATYVQLGSRLPEHENNLPSMLLGFDFFRAHRVLIANSQHMLYFSYNGRPVFDIASQPREAAAPVPQAAPPPEPIPGAPAAKTP